MNKNTLRERVFNYLTTIPQDKVVTYAMIGESLGNKNLARAIGNILHTNKDKIEYPCYKVVNSKGKLSDNYAFGGVAEQERMLESEGIEVVNNFVNLDKYCHKS